MSCCCLNEEELYCSFVFIYLYPHTYKRNTVISWFVCFIFTKMYVPIHFCFIFLHWIIFINWFNTQSFNKYQQCWNKLSPYYCVLPEYMRLPLCLHLMNGTYISPYCVPIVLTVILYWHFFQSVTRLVQKDSEGSLWKLL